AYLLAPVTAVVGPSVVALKLVPVTMWAIAAVLTYFAVTAIAAGIGGSHDGKTGRRIAALAAALVWITPGALLLVSTLAYASYAVGMAVSVAVLLVSARLIDRDRADVITSALVGFVAGLGFYAHPMYLAIIVPTLVPV